MRSSNNNKPLVSVVVPTFNDETHLHKTLDAILSQTYLNIEIIVVDDCSSDGSRNVVNALNDNRVVSLVNERNSGPAATRNRGIEVARGEYIAFCDSDDIWASNKLEQQIDRMIQDDLSFTYTRYDIIDEQGHSYSDSGLIPATATYQSLLPHCFIRTSSIVYRPSAVGGKHYFPLLQKRQDFGLFLSLLRSTPEAHLIDESLCSYRVRQNSVSSNKIKNIPFQWQVYRKAENLPATRSAFLMGRWFFNAGIVAAKRRIDRIRLAHAQS